ncbi:hypothetical protein [Agromyces aerolatus]|uniref:hypothetical protein n=1 Tax=Agromyces sp. LY-1074 TaxID=3074080 RepID=UPI002859C020|nr:MULTISPECIES: hypothetical protein [unclassified Agromyces]MDR5698519.1 hypothetical protein [Agromyces sp. LY-1074]MDR5704813.1 hypothetical protein [Agromyces sp. LY-1358]
MAETDASGSVYRALASLETRLAERLGITNGLPVAVRGELPVPELATVLEDVPRALPWDAKLVLTVVRTRDQLNALPAWLFECGVVVPTWVVHGGTLVGATGAALVRDILRDAGFTTLGSCDIANGWRALRAEPPRI